MSARDQLATSWAAKMARYIVPVEVELAVRHGGDAQDTLAFSALSGVASWPMPSPAIAAILNVLLIVCVTRYAK